MKMEQSVPKRRHIKFRRRGITQKKAYNIENLVTLYPSITALCPRVLETNVKNSDEILHSRPKVKEVR